jgi:hypothetical protein
VEVDGEPVVLNELCKGLHGFEPLSTHILCRIETLQSLLCFVAISRSPLMTTPTRHDATPLSSLHINPQLLTELTRRWTLWRHDIGLRTVRVEGDIVSVLVSPSLCLAISDNRFEIDGQIVSSVTLFF